MQTAQVNPVEVDRTSSLTPARGHTLDTLDIEQSLPKHALTGVNHCQGSTLTGWNVSLNVAFQEGLVAKRAKQLIQPKMFLFYMSPTIGLHGEFCIADCTNEPTFQALFPYHKVLDAWNNKRGDVGYFYFLEKRTNLWSDSFLSVDITWVHHPLAEPGFWQYPSAFPSRALYRSPCAESPCCKLCTSTQCQFSKLNPERLKETQISGSLHHYQRFLLHQYWIGKILQKMF